MQILVSVFAPLIVLFMKLLPAISTHIPRPRVFQRGGGGTYLWQIQAGDYNAMQRARSMLSSIAGIAAWVIFVSIHQSSVTRPRGMEGGRGGGGKTNLNSFVLPVSAPACHGIDSLATLMRVSSEVAEVGLRPASSVSLCFARFSRGGNQSRTEVESSETAGTGHYSEEDLN